MLQIIILLSYRSIWQIENMDIGGEIFQASITINLDTIVTNQTANVATYENAVTDFRMNVAGLEYIFDSNNSFGNYVEVWNDNNYDASYVRDKISIRTSMVGPDLVCKFGCAPVQYMQLNFSGPLDNLSLLNGTHIPTEIPLEGWDLGSPSYYWYIGGGEAFSNPLITVSTVPIPASLYLFASALGFIGWKKHYNCSMAKFRLFIRVG